uniref:RNA-directed RNA polymerase n=1 Tax=Hubei levi-like virus 1 TaxID=1922908 RepID=A0A1L3KIT6_9VIRU|nr:hypothetical protein [Hubei levi-like virus 1]
MNGGGLKSLMLFLRKVLEELGDRCGTSTDLDWKTIETRSENEGFSFITITLTNFASDFQKSLDQGYVAPSQFKSFSFSGGLPRFLGGFLELVFSRKDGRLLDLPSIDAIHAVQQITSAFGKIFLDCSDARVKAAIDGYIKCEKEVRLKWDELGDAKRFQFSRIKTLLFADMFTYVDHSIYVNGVMPKHGPGATAERITSNQKYVFSEWPQRLNNAFPAWENIVATLDDYESLEQLDFLEPGQERPVRVVTVPKTLKTPRIIAIEPVAMQYMQQGILELFEDGVSRFDIPRNFISWKSQIPNQELARKGSADGSLATLDLSEASDRVSNQLVRLLFEDHPHLMEAVDATRSRKADVPGHGVIRLAKFASMGSALCFPIESMVFMTVLFCGIEDELNRPLTRKDIKSYFGRVRTYGDDIIVPTGYVHSVVNSLETFGFKVNSNKSFWTGKFRESCGKYYYDGVDISFVRFRRNVPTQRRHAQEVTSLVETRNHFYRSGMWATVKVLDEHLDSLTRRFGWPFPKVHENSPLLGRLTFLPYEYDKWDQFLHRPLVKGCVMESTLPEDFLDGTPALLKFFLKRSELPFVDRNHLERAGRPDSVRIKVRYGTPY